MTTARTALISSGSTRRTVTCSTSGCMWRRQQWSRAVHIPRSSPHRTRRPTRGRAPAAAHRGRRLHRQGPGRVRAPLRARPRLHGPGRARGRPQRPRADHDAAEPAGGRPLLLRRRVAAAGDPARPDPRPAPGRARAAARGRGHRHGQRQAPAARRPRARAGVPGRLPNALLPDRHVHGAVRRPRLQPAPRRHRRDGRGGSGADGHRADQAPGARSLRLLPALRARACGTSWPAGSAGWCGGCGRSRSALWAPTTTGSGRTSARSC